VVLPYLDGERTPNLPDAAAAVFGLRHTTDPRAILMAAYEGAIVGLLEALEAIDACSSGVDPDAPLILVGGGAHGATWQRVAQRLSGKEIVVPHVREVVSMARPCRQRRSCGTKRRKMWPLAGNGRRNAAARGTARYRDDRPPSEHPPPGLGSGSGSSAPILTGPIVAPRDRPRALWAPATLRCTVAAKVIRRHKEA